METEMETVTVDGSAGGGQLVRSAATFAALAGRPVEVTDVRGARETPGLRDQHVAALRAVAAACDGETEGATVGSERVALYPGALTGGSAHLDVGTAGSLPLVFDAVLPLAARLDAPYRLRVTGGTDVRWAPSMDFLREAKLPPLRRVGLDAAAACERRGFYRAGGGEATLTLRPSALAPLGVDERGPLEHVSVFSVASDDLRGASVAERQAEAAAAALREWAPAPVVRDASYGPTASPGSVVTVVAVYERSRAGFSSLGERGKPAERVADEAVGAFADFHRSGAAVDPHLADQLLPFVALAGGSYTTPERTAHLDAHAALCERFGFDVSVAEEGGVVRVQSVRP